MLDCKLIIKKYQLTSCLIVFTFFVIVITFEWHRTFFLLDDCMVFSSLYFSISMPFSSADRLLYSSLDLKPILSKVNQSEPSKKYFQQG